MDPELLLLDVDPELLLLDVDPELPLLDVDPELLDVDPLAPDELELLLLAPPSVSGGVTVFPPLHAARRPIPERAATRAIEGVFVMPVHFATAIPQTDVATRSRKAGCSARGTRAIHVSPVTTCCTTRHTLRGALLPLARAALSLRRRGSRWDIHADARDSGQKTVGERQTARHAAC